MTSRRVAALAGLIVLGLTGPTLAQVPMMGNLPSFDNAPPAPPPGAGAPVAAPMAPPAGMAGPPPGTRMAPPNPADDPCYRDFMPLRQEAEKRGGLIKAANERKAPRAEFCKLFKNFAVAQHKMVNFITENQATCRIPDEAVKNIKAGYDHTLKIRDQACASGPAAGPAGPPPGPRLSDELGVGRIGGSSTPGRGTFDTLTGNALSR
jgi:hypothetical protein